MSRAPAGKANCWEFLGCDYGPGSPEPCGAVTDVASDTINGGLNAGRLCWAVVGTLSGGSSLAPCAQQTSCLDCDFLGLVRSEEGPSFQLLKLARGVLDSEELQRTIVNLESLMSVHERLRSRFDLKRTIRQITEEARKVTGAQRSIVLLLGGDPPALRGEVTLRREPNEVVIEIDERSAVGYAALHNQMVNLRDIYETDRPESFPTFDRSYDEQCHCRTHSFLAVPINDPQDRVIGVITGVNAKKGYFSSDDAWFMGQYATEVALAVEKQKFAQQSFSAVRLASIGETIAGLSHCIKNIAQALRAGSHVVKRALRSDNLTDVKVAWEILDRHIERLADLSMDVLAYDPVVRQRSGELGLNELVGHVAELFREEAHARAIEITFEPGDGVDPATFDPMGVYRCVVNLVSNALDACPLSEGLVVVSTERTRPNEFMLSVADNGRGMDDVTKAALSELFRTSKPRGGVGLGLPTVADIVRRHNGRIEVESAPGEGTVLRVFMREDVARA